MGDTQTAGRLLQLLDADCPQSLASGVTHRAGVSLWAHAVELIARLGRQNGLRTLVTCRPDQTQGPHIQAASYPDLLIAKAHHRDGALFATLYPGDQAGIKSLTIGGLRPNASYVADARNRRGLQADGRGEASLTLGVDGRTDLRIALRAA